MQLDTPRSFILDRCRLATISQLNCLYYRLPTNKLQTGSVVGCWSSPAQSFLVSSPVGTHDLIYLSSKTVYVFGNGVFPSTRGTVCLSEEAPRLLHRSFALVCTHSHSVQVRAFVLYGHHTRFISLLQ
jgi:hypothetical protein